MDVITNLAEVPTEQIIVDTKTCPVCGSEMVRNSMDDFKSDYDRHYVCHNCDIEEVINPQ